MKLQTSIDRGLKFIAGQQLSSGGFTSYSSSCRRNFRPARSYRTTFFPSIILLALTNNPSPPATKIKRKIADFLLRQKSADWSFNYWDRTSSEFKQRPYPDDLDDTFYALLALYVHDQKLFSGSVLAKITRLLIACEARAGGPYRTWLVAENSQPKWLDVDLAVNININNFLQAQNVGLPNLEIFINSAIRKNRLESLYYPSAYPLLYFISRSRADATSDWQRYLRTKNCLESALITMGALRADLELSAVEEKVEFLLQKQNRDGSWPAEAFCLDPAVNGQTYFAGASALTTALCLEALLAHSQKKTAAKELQSTADLSSKRHQQILSSMRRQIDSLTNADIKQRSHQLLDKIMTNYHSHQIIELPWLVSRAVSSKVPDNTLRQLSEINLWGWMAYTIFDDFLDGEGEPSWLPSAILAKRQLVYAISQTLPDNKKFQGECRQILNRIDSANAWEVNHCRVATRGGHLQVKRLPDYGDYWALSDRSIGHVIAGLGVLYAAKQPASVRRSLMRFFEQYLIARQLNDEAHDWETDLAYGHINAVGAKILRHYAKQHSQALKQPLDLVKKRDELRAIMWEDLAVEVLRTVRYHLHEARAALSRVPADFDAQLFEPLLQSLEQAADQGLAKRQQTIDFIAEL